MAIDRALIRSEIMCGIGGILRIVKPGDPDYPADPSAVSLSSDPRSPNSGWLIPEAWLDAIDEKIAWRGPDGQGRFRDRVLKPDGTIVEVALVHRRLAIIDLADGAQPMICDGCPACEARASSPVPNGGGARVFEGGGGAFPPSLKPQVPSPTPYLLYDPSSPDPPSLRQGSPHLAAVVFNGCIYNHRELRAELESKGHVFATDHSDTEVILHAVRANPGLSDPDSRPEAKYALDGMYAFAYWDRANSGWLFINRDPRGEKPLYHQSIESRRISVFASSPAAVNKCLSVIGYETTNGKKRDEMRPRHSIADWVAFGWSTDDLITGDVRECDRCPATISWFRDDDPRSRLVKARDSILVLAAVIAFLGVFIVVFLGLIALGHYIIAALVGLLGSTGLASLLIKLPVPWALGALDKSIRARGKTPGIEDRFDALLDGAVFSRLDSDVPLGCFLSGGVDSSLIAHYASQHFGRLTTLTVRMPDERYDESHYAKLVAAHLGTNHVTLDCIAESAADDLIHIIDTLGMPFGDSSILPTYWLCRAAREHVKVALAGDGGDELFFGYDRYKAMKYLGWRRFGLKMLSESRLDRSNPKSPDDRKARLITAATFGGYRDLLAIFPTPDRAALLGWSVGFESRHALFGSAKTACHYDLDKYLPGDLLRKVDTASMMCGIEVRCPFLARSVVDAALATPARIHMKGGETKHLLKALARKHFPPEIIDRPKQGFAIPISDWWRTNFGGLRDLLLDSLAGERPFGRVHDVLEFNMDFVRQMLDEHWAAGGLTPMHTTRHVRPRDHGQRLFALVSLAIWSRSLGATTEARRHGVDNQ